VTFLVSLAVGRLIALPATRIGTLAMVMPAATKGAAEILAASVAGMRQEAYPAVAAPHRAVAQLGMIVQDRVQRELILTNKRIGAFVLVPIFAERKDFRDGYSKSTRFSVKMLMVFGISSSYSLDAYASRGRARIFYAPTQKIAQPSRTIDPRAPASRPLLSCPTIATSPAILQRATWKEKNRDADSQLEEWPLLLLS